MQLLTLLQHPELRKAREVIARRFKQMREQPVSPFNNPEAHYSYWDALTDVPLGLVLVGTKMQAPTIIDAAGKTLKAEGELTYYVYTQAAGLRLLEILAFDEFVSWKELLSTMPYPAKITVPKAGVIITRDRITRGYTLGPVELTFIGSLECGDLPLRMNAVENQLIAAGKIPHRYNPGIIYHAG